MTETFDPFDALEAFFAGEIEPADAERLRDWIADNPDRLAEIAERSRIHALLSISGVRLASESVLDSILERGLPSSDSHVSMNPITNAPETATIGQSRVSAKRRAGWCAVVVALVIVAMVCRPYILRDSAVGVVVVADEVQWKSPPIRAGETVPRGEIQIAGGQLEIRFQSQARMTLSGDAHVEVIDEMTVRLHRGGADFHCPKPARGFKVILPNGAEVIDLGTAFAVEVDTQNRSAVLVEEGLVEVRAPGETPVTVTAGNEVAIADRGGQRIGKVSRYSPERRWNRRLKTICSAKRRTAIVMALDGHGNATVPETAAQVHGDPSPVVDRFGKASGALHFDGVDDWLELPADFPPKSFTLLAWFRSEPGNAERRTLFACESADRATAGRTVRLVGDTIAVNALASAADESGDPGLSLSGNGRFQPNRWTHLAVTYENPRAKKACLRVYVNGRQTSEDFRDFVSDVPAMPNRVAIGSSVLAGEVGSRFRGELDDLIVIKRCYEPDQILDLYENSRPELKTSGTDPQ